MELRRFRPERRAVLGWKLVTRAGGLTAERSFYLRVHARLDPGQAALALAAAADAGLPAPRPLGAPWRHVALEAALTGEPFAAHELPAAPELEELGELLGRLHRAPLPALGLRRSVADELDRTRKVAGDLKRIDPEGGARALEVVAEIARRTPNAEPPTVFLHGDLHPGQLLRREAGLALLDFDLAALGAASYDLATLRAHLLYAGDPEPGKSVASALAGYGRVCPPPADGELAWWSACAVLRLAVRPFLTFDPRWPTRGRDLVERAAALVASAR